MEESQPWSTYREGTICGVGKKLGQILRKPSRSAEESSVIMLSGLPCPKKEHFGNNPLSAIMPEYNYRGCTLT